MARMQALLLRWLPIGAIAITEIVLLTPVREAIARREWASLGDWSPILALAAFCLALTWVGLRGLPNPNGKTIGGYLVRLVEFAIVFAPFAATPFRRTAAF